MQGPLETKDTGASETGAFVLIKIVAIVAIPAAIFALIKVLMG